jgi:hypothetical protein
MPQLEKVKDKLLETEIPKFKAEYENPYRVPSNDLMMLFAADFQKAPPLTYKPFDPEAEAEEKLKASELVLPGEAPASAGPKAATRRSAAEQICIVFYHSAPPGTFVPDTGSGDDDAGDAAQPSVPQQLTFRNFVQIVNTVGRFMKMGDQAGLCKVLRYFATSAAGGIYVLHALSESRAATRRRVVR